MKIPRSDIIVFIAIVLIAIMSVIVLANVGLPGSVQ